MKEANPSGGSGDEPPSSNLLLKEEISSRTPKRTTGSYPAEESGFFSIETIADIEKCQLLFEEFSQKKNLFDTWEFRYSFYKAYKFKPHFLLLRKGNENLALLPLWYDEDKKMYTWFGSDWQEEVSFFAKDLNLMPILLSAAPTPLFLNAISKESLGSLEEKIVFAEDSSKFILNLNGFKNHEDFLMTMKKSRRHDLRKDRRRIESQNPEIIINNFSDIDQLIALSKKRLNERGKKADWEDPRRIETFKEVIRQGGKSYQVRMITIKINGVAAGVDLVCLYNDTYFAVKCGYDVKNFSGIGNFMNIFEIDDAIRLGMKKIDLLQNNYEWKDRWFQSVPLVKYEK